VAHSCYIIILLSNYSECFAWTNNVITYIFQPMAIGCLCRLKRITGHWYFSIAAEEANGSVGYMEKFCRVSSRDLEDPLARSHVLKDKKWAV
jgi:hypothetical protein